MLRFPQDLVVVAGRHALQVADHEHENLATILVIRQVHGKPSASVLRRRTEQKLHYRLNLMPRDLVSPPGHGVLGYAPRAAGYGFTGLIRQLRTRRPRIATGLVAPCSSALLLPRQLGDWR